LGERQRGENLPGKGYETDSESDERRAKKGIKKELTDEKRKNQKKPQRGSNMTPDVKKD